jgi:hypothetical protein
MTYDETVTRWRREIAPAIPPTDLPARRESWIAFVDDLERDGEISTEDAADWSHPPENRAGDEPRLEAPPAPGVTFHGRTYVGRAGSLEVEVHEQGGAQRTRLPFRHDLRNHSPDGFAWGYGGSGPAQLALALLAYELGDDEKALEWYQAFKWEVVARFPLSLSWGLSSGEIRRVVAELEAAQGAL